MFWLNRTKLPDNAPMGSIARPLSPAAKTTTDKAAAPAGESTADAACPAKQVTSSQWTPLDRAKPSLHLEARALVLTLFLLGALAAGGYLLWAYRPLPRQGTLLSVRAGSLRGQTDGETWVPLQVDATIQPGQYLQSDQGTIATIGFFDGSAMRIESQGEWQIERVDGGLGGLVSRVTIRQVMGRASVVSAPLQPGTSTRMDVRLPGGTLHLVGVATLTTDQEGTHILLLQGQGRLQLDKGQVLISPGQTVYLGANGEAYLEQMQAQDSVR